MKKFQLGWLILETLQVMPTPLDNQTLARWLYQENEDNWSSLESARVSIGQSLRLLQNLQLIERVPNLFNSRNFLFKLSDKGRAILHARGGTIGLALDGVQQTPSTT